MEHADFLAAEATCKLEIADKHGFLLDHKRAIISGKSSTSRTILISAARPNDNSNVTFVIFIHDFFRAVKVCFDSFVDGSSNRIDSDTIKQHPVANQVSSVVRNIVNNGAAARRNPE